MADTAPKAEAAPKAAKPAKSEAKAAPAAADYTDDISLIGGIGPVLKKKLEAAGARVQRPLWASTSTKDPSYPDLLYVDNLIGPHTVNTVPPETLTKSCPLTPMPGFSAGINA